MKCHMVVCVDVTGLELDFFFNFMLLCFPWDSEVPQKSIVSDL